jgi:hypothetical protein
MRELIEFSGATGYLLLLMGVSGVMLALGAVGLAAFTRAFRPALMLAGLTLGIGVTALLLGFGARTRDMQTTYRAVAHANPADRATILAGSRHEAQANVTLGAMVSLPLLLLSFGAIGAAFGRTGGAR